MKYKSLSDIHRIHAGETIYLIGNGPAILDIPDDYKSKIKNGISIGVNSSHLFMPTTYQVCSTWSCYLLSCYYGEVSGCRFYQGQGIGNDSSWPFGGATIVSPDFFSEYNTIDIHSHMSDPIFATALVNRPTSNSAMWGRDNIMFSATNLATIMGAKEVVYLGFDQRNNGHYYDVESLMEVYKQQTNEMKKMYSLDPHILKDLEDMEYKNISKEETPQYLKVKNSNKGKLESLFSHMGSFGITPVVHVKDSVVYDAGAEWRDYEDE